MNLHAIRLVTFFLAMVLFAGHGCGGDEMYIT